MSKERVAYTKPTGRKLMGGGGPRDMQRRQQSTGTLNAPKFDIKELEELKNLLEEKLGAVPDSNAVKGIPEEEVEERIAKAIDATRNEEAERYKSGLESLNEQLNAAKVKISFMEEKLEEAGSSEEVEILKNKVRAKDGELKGKDKHIAELEKRLQEGGIPVDIEEELEGYRKEIARLKNNIRTLESAQHKASEKDDKIKELKQELDSTRSALENANARVKELENTAAKSNDDFVEMKATMELMFKKISELQLSAVKQSDPEDISIDEHKVFIDPTEEKENLTSHIEIEATSTVGGNRNIKQDLNKLRNLVDKGKYKPSRAKSKLLE